MAIRYSTCRGRSSKVSAKRGVKCRDWRQAEPIQDAGGRWCGAGKIHLLGGGRRKAGAPLPLRGNAAPWRFQAHLAASRPATCEAEPPPAGLRPLRSILRTDADRPGPRARASAFPAGSSQIGSDSTSSVPNPESRTTSRPWRVSARLIMCSWSHSSVGGLYARR